MNKISFKRSAAVALALVASASWFVASADAQTQRRAARVQPQAEPQVPMPAARPIAALVTTQAPGLMPGESSAKPEAKCLRALNGNCVNSTVAEDARLRAIVIPAMQVSYLGTPAGYVGGAAPIDRFFQDNPFKFGLPTVILVDPGCCIRRTK